MLLAFMAATSLAVRSLEQPTAAATTTAAAKTPAARGRISRITRKLRELMVGGNGPARGCTPRAGRENVGPARGQSLALTTWPSSRLPREYSTEVLAW